MSPMTTREPLVLVTESGKRIPELQLQPSHFLDRVSVLYGPTKTGKTVIVKHAMKLVSGHIDQVFIISPTEPSNRSYEGMVDSPLIHYRLWMPDPSHPKKDDEKKGAARFLEAIYQRQEMMAAIYTRANELETLARLYSRLSKEVRVEGLKNVEILNKKRERAIEAIRKQFSEDAARREEKIKESNEKFKQILALLYKKYIVPHYEVLMSQRGLSEDEKYSLQYLNFNPRMLLVFDDCAAQLKPLFNKEIFRKVFYQGRHVFISCIICCQDDTDLPANLRKNALVSIFTDPVVASSNFDRTSNKFSKPAKQYVQEILPEVFQGHRKLAYIREDDKRQNFYHITATKFPNFKFGSLALRELCSLVKASGVTMDRENNYFKYFSIE